MLTAEQKQRRLGKITSSNAAACLGLDDRKTPIQAWCDITGQDYGAEGPDEKACERGDWLEEIVCDYGSEVVGADVGGHVVWHKPNFRSAYPWLGDSCDAEFFRGADTVAIGEAKTASMRAAESFGEEGTDDIPTKYLIQCHVHLIHWPETDVCYVPVLVGGHKFEFRCYKVRRNPEFHGLLLQDLERFHADHVVSMVPPPVSACDRDWVCKRHPIAAGDYLPSTPEVAEWARKKAAASAELKKWEAVEEEAKTHLRAILGDHQGVKAEWGKVTWTNNKPRTVTDHKLAAEDLAKLCVASGVQEQLVDEILQRATREVPGARVLRVTIKEEDNG